MLKLLFLFAYKNQNQLMIWWYVTNVLSVGNLLLDKCSFGIMQLI